MKKLYLAAIAGNLGMLSVGQFLGWTSPSLAVLMQGKDEGYPIHLTPQEAAWVASLPTLGGIAGAIICAVIINIFGRKNIMLFTVVPSIISWLMIAFATSLTELYISKFTAGLAIGITLTVTPIYLGEISPPHIRGNLTCMSIVAVNIGILVEFVIGPFLSVQNLTFVSLIAPCLFMLIFIWLPESPYYLMSCNAKEETINSLVQLRGKKDVYNEACNIEQFVKASLDDQTDFRELLCVPSNRRTLIIMLCLSIIQKMSGYQAILNYAQIIFDQMNVNLEGKYLTMILGVVQLIFTIICMFITDHSGRRSLLIISCIGIITYIMMYALGLSSQPFTLLSEIFPMNVKALGSMIILITKDFFEFVVITSYLIIADIAGIHVPFWIFTACNFAGALFIFFYVPETKGKTLEQIQKELQRLSKQ
ncbi:facilitated trehalose transporter Tret1 isoform X2 [Camponotus floridanus]|uniref:facilitated trehalose transporter Tret1-like isoform X2 n=1 Tax=Camponotus floridanus TaxID=104421 RepID=UPI000DC69380|nr:facilitated trehalose transporter Tret1-like isoform X2 [Camponotus floridanus]XP_025262134.1 facilitated trehalose transporter Tret1 isoform X2 [Camponotus floridanus]